MVLGDFNARVGSDNTNRERIMGKHGTGIMTDNGSRLCDICGENDLVIGGTLFQHKTIHKLTWRSPDGRTESQIDHILVTGKWRRSLQDVKTRRLADVGSDHNLLIGKLALKLRKAKTGEKKKERFDTTKLQNPETKQQFTIALKNSFGILHEETYYTQFQHGHGANRESSARLQKSKERAVDFHINLGQNRPKERNKEKAAHHKVPKT